VAFSPDGSRLASGSSDSTVRLWDVKGEQPIGPPLEGHTALVSAVVFSDDGKSVVSGSYDRTVRWWNAETGARLGQPVIAEGLVRALAVRPGAAQVAAASLDGALEIWNTADVLPLDGSAVTFTPDGKRLALGAVNGFLSVYDPGTGQRLGVSSVAHPHGVTKMAYAADGRYLVSGDFNGGVWVWKADNGIPIDAPVRQSTDASISAITFSGDTHRFAVGNENGVVRLGDAETGQWTGPPLKAPGGVAAISFTADGTEIPSVHADTAHDPTIRRWNAATGAQVSSDPIELLTAAVFASAEHLATGSIDGLVTVFGPDFKPVADPISGHTGTVMALAYTADGDQLASADQYGSIRMWLPATAKPVGKAFGDGSSLVWNLALSPDGRMLASANSDGMVRLWPASGTPADLCAKLESNMSHRQWSDWVSPDITYVATCPDLPIAPD
jgi:WD40 repeat protein